jgi:DmsE family decaheme c-type cytochrome
MKINYWNFRLVLFFGSMLFIACVHADQAAAEYTGSDKCQACHKQQNRVYVNSQHGLVFTYNPRNQNEARGCESCHGPGSKHVKVVGELDYKGPLYIRNFKDESSADGIVNTCMGCHEGGTRMHWRSSEHALVGVSCINCHRIHVTGKTADMGTCFGCHKTERAKLQRSMHMPIREGKITCMDCHNPHGGVGPSLLKTATVNETCYQCHPDKRGPYLFEHPPVQDSCVNCHDPHGSTFVRLLKKKPPYLCQQCHVVAFHPSTLYDGADLNDPSVKQLRAKACLNCHSRIHGSNHPSGARFQR